MDLHIGMADGVQQGFCGLVAQVPDVDVHHGELGVYELGEGVIIEDQDEVYPMSRTILNDS